jgi:hypothetical protein
MRKKIKNILPWLLIWGGVSVMLLRYDLKPPKATEKIKQLQTFTTPINENVLWVQIDTISQKMSLLWNDAPITTQELSALLRQKSPKELHSTKIHIANQAYLPKDSLQFLQSLLQNTSKQVVTKALP